MNIITNVFKSSLGKKYIMAVTGFVLFLFVIGHLAGNLQIFLGREAINRYGHFLQIQPRADLAGAAGPAAHGGAAHLVGDEALAGEQGGAAGGLRGLSARRLQLMPRGRC